MKTILWIDDIRKPTDYLKLIKAHKIIVAYNYESAIEALNDYIFDIISFDHDLGEDKTGYDIAKYIVENQIQIKEGFQCHSANPVGIFNIKQLLTHYGYRELKS